MPRSTSDYYDRYSAWYDQERELGYYGLINDLEFDVIIDAVRQRDVLEIGSGTGLILERTSRVARSAWGVDLSRGMVDVTRAKGLSAVQASADHLPFRDRSFEVVYSFKVLPHVPEIETAISEVRRVLKPGGRAFLEFYNPRSIKWLANRAAGRMKRDPGPYIRYDGLATIRSYLPRGTRVVRVRGIRIFGVTRHFYTLPVLGSLMRALERATCDGPLGRLGGYFVVELAFHDE